MTEKGNETDPPIPAPADTKAKTSGKVETGTEPRVGTWPEPSTDPEGDARREEARVQRVKDRKNRNKEQTKESREGLYDGGPIPR